MQSQGRYAGIVGKSQRGFAGGADKPPMDASNTEFDILFVGGGGVAGLLKQMQVHEDCAHLKMGLVSRETVYTIPQVYFNALHEHKKLLNLESATLPGMIDAWSMINNNVVTKLSPEASKVTLDDGRELTYKALVMAPGFETSASLIPGLKEFDEGSQDNNVYVHQLDSKDRAYRNFYNGYYNRGGDLVTYSPAFPYKGEGTDFYALYYESFLRQDKFLDLQPAGAKIVYISPNKTVVPFPYANEVILDECHKRGVEVHLGWEMTSIQEDGAGVKTMTLRNVDTGATIEKDFSAATVNPTSRPWDWVREAGVTDAAGLVDVNRYTLQHKKYENIFAFGDCIAGDTTRTMSAIIKQAPVVKNNVLRFLHGQEANGVYDGFTQQILHLGTFQSTTFSHLHDFEPTTMNHWAPHYGLPARLYAKHAVRSQFKQGEAYLNHKKNHGAPYKSWPATYDELEHNEYLQKNAIPLEEVRFQGGEVKTA